MLRGLFVTSVLFGFALMPHGALASSAKMADGHLVYVADEGEANALTIERASEELLTVTDTGAVIRASNGCVLREPHVAECGHTAIPEGGDLHWHSIDVGDRSDTVRVEAPGELSYLIRGGPGDDALFGSNQNDGLVGDAGDDRLEGAGGDDGISGQAGADLMRGGPGTDEVSYAERTAGIHVSIGDGPGDGEPGEADDVQTENVTGGEGDDVLVGNDVANELVGAGGADLLDGRGGDDELSGSDASFGSHPESGPARDVMRCGTGLDGVYVTGSDHAPDDCEQVSHGALIRMRLVGTRRTGRGRIRATVRRVDWPSPSVAEAQISVPCGPVGSDGTRCWRRIGRTRAPVNIPRGEERGLEVVLSRAGRVQLRRRPRMRVRLTVVAHDPEFRATPDARVELRLRLRLPRP